MNTKMYVGNLPFTATEDDVRALFTDYGTVTDIHLPMDRDSGRPRGFAFVTMDSQTAMNEAIRGLNEKDYGGRNLTINEARPKEDRPAGGGFGKFRCHHLTGAAPWSPEIHQDRQFALSHERGKIRRTCDLDRCSHVGQLSFAGAAAALQGGFGVDDAVGGAAGRTWQNDATIIGGQVGAHKGK